MVIGLHVYLKRLLSEYVTSRESVKIIEQEISNSEKEVILDFEKISFITPSFIDELQDYIKNNTDVKFRIINANDKVSKMFEVVASRKRKARKKEQFKEKDFQSLDLKEVPA